MHLSREELSEHVRSDKVEMIRMKPRSSIRKADVKVSFINQKISPNSKSSKTFLVAKIVLSHDLLMQLDWLESDSLRCTVDCDAIDGLSKWVIKPSTAKNETFPVAFMPVPKNFKLGDAMPRSVSFPFDGHMAIDMPKSAPVSDFQVETDESGNKFLTLYDIR